MSTHKKPNRKNVTIRVLVTALLAVFVCIVLLRNWPTVDRSIRAARGADVRWLGVALIVSALTYLLAAAIYNTLALKRLRYRQTLLVELSTAFVNRLLPSGLGGLGVHGVYLFKRGHTAVEATAVVSANNLLGMGAHLLLLATAVAYRPSIVSQLSRHFHVSVNGWLLLILVVALVVLASIPALRNKVVVFIASLVRSVRKIGPLRTGKALGLAMLLTLTYTTILLMSAVAVGLEVSFLQVFVVFSIGMLFSTATPTPGGLVGAEAGLFAGFVGYGIAAAPAGAAVLLYRLATYWIPLLPGLLALYSARRRHLL
jgi:uncharacterized membrane protein YbhN (UPF0104 family)